MTRLASRSIVVVTVVSAILSVSTTTTPARAEQNGSSQPPTKFSIRVEPITDIWPGKGGISPGIGKVFRGEVYFAAHNRGDGRDIWRFDGNRVAIAVETNRAAFEYGVRVETVFKDRLLYTLPPTNGGYGLELWEYNGQTSRQVSGVLLPGGVNLHFSEYRGELYFGGIDAMSGAGLCKYDGNVASLVKAMGSPNFMTDYQDALYFFADDGVHGEELWRCDGTKVELVADIAPGIRDDGRAWDSRFFDSLLNGGVVYQDRFVFGAHDEKSGYELRAWDGKEVTLLADINPGPDGSWCANLCVFAGQLYFSASSKTPEDRAAHRRELWKFDGKRATLVADGAPGAKWKSVAVMGTWDDYLILVADDEKHGPEPWYFDGHSTRLIADVLPGPTGSWAALRTTMGQYGIGEGTFPNRGLEVFRLVKDSRASEDSPAPATSELRDLAEETRALRKAVEALDERVQRLSSKSAPPAPEREVTNVAKDIELLHAGTVSGKEYRVVCQQAGTIGKLVIRAGSKVDLDERLAVGQRGTGVLKVLDGGALANLVRADIGEQVGSYGSVVIAGHGSEWKTPMGVEIGSRGHGRLEVTDGGFFSNGARADIGNQSGSTGEVRVIGKDSRWITEWGIEVGPAGAGVLLIADGGQVRNGARFDVGAHETGNGQVFVCGKDSSWTCSGGGTVGQKGTGSVTVQVGGSVTAHSFEVGPRGSIGGDGTIHGNIRNAGVVRPGGVLLVKGRFEQEPTGTLLMQPTEVGDGLSELRIDGPALLNGILDLSRCQQLSNKAADIPIVTAEKIENEFRDVRFPTSPGNWTCRVKYTAKTVSVEVRRAKDVAGNKGTLSRIDH